MHQQPEATSPATDPHPAATHAPLPDFIEPMFAQFGEPFDSDDHLFEIKWDGIRALLFVDSPGRYRLINRRRTDMTWKYPDLSCVANLPAGTVLDGELVALGPDGRPDFTTLQSREQTRTPARAQQLCRSNPVTLVAFDQIYDHFNSLLNHPLSERRELLRATVAKLGNHRVVASDGIIGHGRAYFEQAAAMGLEGVVAKRLSSPYLPGKRTEAWTKIKRQQVHCCLVIGFVPGQTASGAQAKDFRNLIIAADVDGTLQCVGKVGSGFDGKLRDRVNQYLWTHLRPRPVIPCKEKGARWVEPGLYCNVRCIERTTAGVLRWPALVDILQRPLVEPGQVTRTPEENAT